MRSLAVAVLPLALACSSSSPQKKDATTTPAATPAVNLLDSGKFVVAVGEQTIGEETFEIIDRQVLGFEMKTTTKLGDDKQTVEQTASLSLDAHGRPSGATIDGKQGETASKAKLTRVETSLVLEVDGKTVKEQRPSDLFIANGIIAHWAPVCALASDEAKVASVFPGIPLRIEPVAIRKVQLTGKDGTAAATDLAYVATDYMGQRVELTCDGVHLMALYQPTSGVLAARPGFEVIARRLAQVNRPKPTVPPTLVEEDRLVASGDATLACSFIVPKAPKKKLPAVVFVTSTGPQDRDDDGPGVTGIKLALYKDLAIALGNAGIGSLRCDDRGVERSSGRYDAATLDVFAADTAATVAALRKEPTVDPRRVGLIGHAEGAVIAPIIAGNDKQVKALVLLAAPARPLDTLMVEAVTRRGSDVEAQKQIAAYGQALDAIRADKPLPETLPAELRRVVEPQRAWLRSHMKHDPKVAAAKVKIPVFIGHGGKDPQIPEGEGAALSGALTKSGNGRVVFKSYPELGHYLAAGGTADSGARTLQVDPTFMGDVVTFLAKSL
jgi:fermentation-respiration switch protein FrsA (DUF1100 family)